MKHPSLSSSIFYLPMTLVIVFVIQNILFNAWVNLTPNPHLALFIFESSTLGILLYGPSVLLGRYVRPAYLLIIAMCVSLIFISQYLYFSFFEAFLQASALKYVGQVGAEQSTIFALATSQLLVFLINIAMVVVAVIFSREGKSIFGWRPLSRNGKFFATVGIILSASMGYGLLFTMDENGLQKILHPAQTLHDLNSFTFSQNQLVQRVGVVNYSIGDVIGSLLRETRVTDEDAAFVKDLLSQKTGSFSANKYFGIARGRDLIVIQFESLEQAVMEQTVDGTEITPNLNALSREGLYFDNYYSQVGPGNTADAEFVMLNSLYPLTNTVAFIDFAHNTYRALPKFLVEQGYQTYALHGDVSSFWNRANIYPALGYETSVSKESYIPVEIDFETLSDEDFFSQTISQMKLFPHPFMATLITLSSHSPYIIPKNNQTLPIPDDLPLSAMQRNYLESIHYADAALGNFIAALKANSLYDDALIVIYGDHGSFTGISEHVGASSTNEFGNLRASQVPLMIIAGGSGLSMQKIIHTPGSHLDLYPTIVELLGFAPPQNIFGRNLLGMETPVVTRRDPYSKIITNILTPSLTYVGTDSGIFEEGTCRQPLEGILVPIMECKNLYDAQLANINASDFVVRGDLLKKFLTIP